ncbi:J domain-containing protein [Marinobacter sp. VGCF2001]|uniref:J domain-containing protein n=1 Tax=Marinobacter sp. VGCF2001 TaxID=3417189 RepID=UPI003CEFFA33
MNCWDLLGIEPTGDTDQIRQAYERQLKFASDDEARDLELAFREATGGPPPKPAVSTAGETSPAAPPDSGSPESLGQRTEAGALSAEEAQIAREVVIQIRALMNDTDRQQDVSVWKAILCEPPADRAAVRREIADQLEPQIRPLAENGALAGPVTRFLGDWFEWFSLKDVQPEPDPRTYPEGDGAGRGMGDPEDDTAEQPPQMVNFWPAVIGWIIGLVILATLFGGMSGS